MGEPAGGRPHLKHRLLQQDQTACCILSVKTSQSRVCVIDSVQCEMCCYPLGRKEHFPSFPELLLFEDRHQEANSAMVSGGRRGGQGLL